MAVWACGDGLGAADTWTLDLGTLQWQRMDPVNGPRLPADCSDNCNVYQIADYDRNTQTVFFSVFPNVSIR
jgi:hypothetical protein